MSYAGELSRLPQTRTRRQGKFMPGKRQRIIIGLCTILLAGAGAFSAERAASSETMYLLTQANNAFAWDLYDQLRLTEGNLFFSPYSISSALAMTYAGARGNTEKQIAETLHFTLGQDALHPAFYELNRHIATLGQDHANILQIANSLWVERGLQLLQAFAETGQEYYNSNLFQVDFSNAAEACRTEINKWVAEHTEQKVTELLHKGDVTRDTSLVLTNAVYFKADWLTPFDEKDTTNGDFWIAPDTRISLPMMRLKSDFEYAEDAFGQIAVLPYVGEKLYMILALPWAKDGLTALEAGLDSKTIDRWIEKLMPRKLNLTLPQFTMRSRLSLIEILREMGVTDTSNFSGMTTPPLPLADIVHEAFIDVNEHGTEAAAATAVSLGRSLPRYVEFHADHPFLYFIYDSTSKSILFIGRVSDPSA
ncbi:hypothetical protein CSB45_07400 [candidate division KSB3 bacterium]|uniref:Serpin domain-containing protein n=1 Tax=candidate division KSB3 bacterium TaxID=2044937 RepID=A0A2G6E660_9BACT|nr:MAG: hypothetical protein CSB45_07400 [candidate division KSB3 bacterium]